MNKINKDAVIEILKRHQRDVPIDLMSTHADILIGTNAILGAAIREIEELK